MKLRTTSRLKGIFLPAIAALLLGMSAISCSSTGDGSETDPEATEETATNNGDPLSNNANAESGEAAAEGEEVAEGGNGELNNLVNEGTADAAAPVGDAAVSNEAAGADPFANQVTNPAATAEAAPTTNGTDPFAPANGAPVADAPATEAAPQDNAPIAPESNVTVQTEPAIENTQAAAPVASAAGEYVPENGTKMPYYIQKGDTLASISQKIYGSSSQWRTLAEENNVLNPNKIYPGSALYYTLSEKSRSFADRYERSAKGSHTVASGETLSSIAAKVLGSEHAWRTLWKMNPSIQNPDFLKVGQVVYFNQEGAVAIKNATLEDEGTLAQVDVVE
jgi:nucleoid-associated protein YgaU